MPPSTATAETQLHGAGVDQPTCVHPPWCDRSRCVRHEDTGDVNHLSAVQVIEVDAEFGGGRLAFWLYRYDEKLRSGVMDTGDADVVAQLTNGLGERLRFYLDPAALAAFGATVAGLYRQEPCLVVSSRVPSHA